MAIFKWLLDSDHDAYEMEHVVAQGEDVTEARRNVLDNMEALFQYCRVSSFERQQILNGNAETFQYVADKRQEFAAQVFKTISEDPQEDVGNGLAYIC